MKDLIADLKRLNRVSMLAGLLVGLGMILWMFASKSFVWVIAIGAFGPGLLRELGWIKDHDEFQRHAAHRAGYHAYLFTGVLISVFATGLAVSSDDIEPGELVNFLLATTWLAWVFSSLLSYWGARKTTTRVLLIFGAFWTFFVLANVVNPEVEPSTPWWEGLIGFLFGTTLIALFFVPAWAAHRWPRVTGWVLVAAGIILTFMLSGGDNLPLTTRLMTNTMLMVPMLVCGTALIIETGRAPTEEIRMAD